MKKLSFVALTLSASPALAAAEPFFSLRNTNFVVLIAFLVFVGILVWQKVPALLAGLLDDRANMIRNQLDEARLLREEAKALLASYDAKHRQVQEQSLRIIASAKEEAQAAAAKAKIDLHNAIARRVAAAEEQIASAVKAAEIAVRNQAINVSVAAAGDILSAQMKAGAAGMSRRACCARAMSRDIRSMPV